MSKTRYTIVFSEELGEVQAVFDTDGKIIAGWSCNDATWREEYFASFMKHAGVKVSEQWDGPTEYQLIQMKKWFNWEDE